MPELGFATRDITPDRPAMIQGQKHLRVGKSALDPITVTAWAISDEGTENHTVLVSCDIVSPSNGLTQSVRRMLKEQIPSLPSDSVILAATHTHTSLVTEDGAYEHPGGDVMTPAECETWIADRIVEAVTEAWKSRRKCAVGRAFGHAVVGHNRYAVYAGGVAQMYGKSNREDFTSFGGYEDHSLDMMFVWASDGRLSGLLLVIPCPSQVDENLRQFSADYWHDVRLELKRRLGKDVSILGLCGAAGDQSPHFLLYNEQEKEMRERRDVTERQEIAQRVADAVDRALACTTPDSNQNCPIRHVSRHLDLTPRQISKQERDWAESAHAESVAKGDTESWWRVRLRAVVDTYDGLRKAEPVPAHIHAVRIGDAVMTTNPFELFLDYSLRIKARSPASQTFVVQLAGSGFYLPTERAVQAGGYGAMPAVSAAGPEGGGELVEETLNLIRELFPESDKKEN